ncbi:MAG: SURF1 family protein [Candidatus Nanopelagicales bacterium]
MWSLLRSRRWQGFTALVVVAIVGFGLLSSWQWQRAEEERQAKNLLVAQTQQEPIDLDAALDQPAALTAEADLYRPVETTGRYLPEATVLVRQRPLDGRNGLWVVSAFVTETGRLIWVNRGWMPATAASTTVIDAPAPPAGEITIDGRLRLTEVQREVADDLPAGQVRWVDTEVLAARTIDLTNADTTVLPVYLEAVSSNVGEPDLLRLPLPEIDETQNVSYAVQWLIFAAIALTGWFYFLRREAKDDAKQRAEVT